MLRPRFWSRALIERRKRSGHLAVALAVLVLSSIAVSSGMSNKVADARHDEGPSQVQPDALIFLPFVASRLHADALPVVPTTIRVPTHGSPTRTLVPVTPTSPSTVTPPPTNSPEPTEPPATATNAPTPPGGSCGGVPTFADGIEPVRELHVAVDGDDSTGDGSLERPYATIRHAARQARPGTAVRVHAGTYQGGTFVEDVAGTADAPIWIGGAPGEATPLLQGGGAGLHLVRTRYMVVHDLEIAGPTNNGLNADDGGDYGDDQASAWLVFRDMNIHDVGGGGNQDCLKLSGVRSFVVLDSSFSTCGGGFSGSGIDMVGCHHGVIARNTFRDHSGNAVQAKGGTSDVEVRWNRMHDAGQRAVNMGGSTGFDYFRPPLSRDEPNAEASDIRVVANIMEGSIAPLAFVGCVDCLAANNTIIDADRWLMRILQETTSRDGYAFLPASNGVLVNNLFQFKRAQLSTYVNIGPNTAADTFSFLNNLWYADDNPAQSQPNLPGTETGGISGQDPRLGPGYSLDSMSVAAGAGRRVDGVAGDITGRCYRDPPSIGAYEVP